MKFHPCDWGPVRIVRIGDVVNCINLKTGAIVGETKSAAEVAAALGYVLPGTEQIDEGSDEWRTDQIRQLLVKEAINGKPRWTRPMIDYALDQARMRGRLNRSYVVGILEGKRAEEPSQKPAPTPEEREKVKDALEKLNKAFTPCPPELSRKYGRREE